MVHKSVHVIFDLADYENFGAFPIAHPESVKALNEMLVLKESNGKDKEFDSAYIPKKTMIQEVHNDIRDIFNMPNRGEAENLLRKCIQKYETTASDLAKWLEGNISEGLTVFNIVSGNLNAIRRLRTNNGEL